MPLRARAALATRGRSGLGRLHQTPGGKVRRRSCVEGKAQSVSEERRGPVGDQIDTVLAACRGGWQVLREKGPGQITFWFIALLIGIAAGFAALFFRKGVEALQQWLYGVEDIRTIHSFAESLPWVMILHDPGGGGAGGGADPALVHPRWAGAVRGRRDRGGRSSTTGGWRRRAGLDSSAIASMITLGSGRVLGAGGAGGAISRR